MATDAQEIYEIKTAFLTECEFAWEDLVKAIKRGEVQDVPSAAVKIQVNQHLIERIRSHG